MHEILCMKFQGHIFNSQGFGLRPTDGWTLDIGYRLMRIAMNPKTDKVHGPLETPVIHIQYVYVCIQYIYSIYIQYSIYIYTVYIYTQYSTYIYTV